MRQAAEACLRGDSVVQTALGAEALSWQQLRGAETGLVGPSLVVREGWPEAGVVVWGSFMPGLDFALSFEKPLKGFKQRRDSFGFLYEKWIEVRRENWLKSPQT